MTTPAPNNGGPAFPQPIDDMGTFRAVTAGMSLRQYYAAHAMQGLCSNPSVIFGHHRCPEHPADCSSSIADAAFALADALLAHEKPTPEHQADEATPTPAP